MLRKILCFMFLMSSLQAAYLLKDGKLIDSQYQAKFSAEVHFQKAQEAIEHKDWQEAKKQLLVIDYNFPEYAFEISLDFHLAKVYYQLSDIDLANKRLSYYLEDSKQGGHFLEAIQYKFLVADRFAKGAKKHLFSKEKLPKLFSDREEALRIYDEIIQMLPSHDLAAKALYLKAKLLCRLFYFKESAESYQVFLKKFSGHRDVPDVYLSIADLYLKQLESNSRNPDLIDLAQIYYNKFQKDYPQHKNIQKFLEKFSKMQEIYAQDLYKTGLFFEKKKQPQASVIYYSSVLMQYPKTSAAELSKKRLEVLDNFVKKMGL